MVGMTPQNVEKEGWHGRGRWLYITDGDSLPAGRNFSLYIGMKIICSEKILPQVKEVIFEQGEEFDSYSFCAWINLIFNRLYSFRLLNLCYSIKHKQALKENNLGFFSVSERFACKFKVNPV